MDFERPLYLLVVPVLLSIREFPQVVMQLIKWQYEEEMGGEFKRFPRVICEKHSNNIYA
jgi:hypothetical protein